MAHRTDTGAALPSTWQSAGAPNVSQIPRPDPGEPDMLAEMFNPDKPRAWWWHRPSSRAMVYVTIIVLLTATLIAAALAPWPVGAQEPTAHARGMFCHKAAEIAKHLSQKYHEAPVAMGLQSNGNILQIYSAEKTGTWTAVTTTTAGMSCVVAAGDNWEILSSANGQRADITP